jgi:beta-galactosidase
VSLKRTLGTCYYPEHWPEETWAEDAARMAGLGLTWVRIGEFAWSRLEPEPGRFDWGWMDRAFDVLTAAGLKIVSGHAHRHAAALDARPSPRHAGRRRRRARAGLRLPPALLFLA